MSNVFKINTITFEMSRCSLKQIKLRSKFEGKSRFVHRTHGLIVLECLMCKACLSVILKVILWQAMWQTSSRTPASGWSPPQSAGKGRKLPFKPWHLCMFFHDIPSFYISRLALLSISFRNLQKPIYRRKLLVRESLLLSKFGFVFASAEEAKDIDGEVRV